MEIKNVSHEYGWPGLVLTISGSDFGPAGINHAGLKSGNFIHSLNTISWANDQVQVIIPDSIDSRAYELGIFKGANLAIPASKVKSNIVVPARAAITNPKAIYKVPNIKLNPALKQTPESLCPVRTYFIALGPEVAGFTGSDSSYYAQVAGYSKKYGFDQNWEAYMMKNSVDDYYRDAHNTYKSIIQPTLQLTYSYEKSPALLTKAFSSEEEHMKLFTKLLSLSFPGIIYNFDVKQTATADNAPENSFARIIAFTEVAGGESDPLTNIIRIFVDGTIIHEFAHRMGLYHHFPLEGPSISIFPDEKCVMDKNSQSFCRACSMAMGLDWNMQLQNAADVSNLVSELNAHFPAFGS